VSGLSNLTRYYLRMFDKTAANTGTTASNIVNATPRR
jgi:hypothetical protein